MAKTEFPFLIRKLQPDGAFFTQQNLETLRDSHDGLVTDLSTLQAEVDALEATVAGLTTDIGVQDNGTLIGTRPTIDFLDTIPTYGANPGVAPSAGWTIADDGANTRVTIAPQVVLPVHLWVHELKTSDSLVDGATNNTEGSAATIITTTSKNYDGNTVLVEFQSQSVQVTATVPAFTVLTFVLLRDSTVIAGRFGRIVADNTVQSPVRLAYRDTPSAAAHTYTVKAYVGTTNDDASISGAGGGSGSPAPMFLRVTRDLG